MGDPLYPDWYPDPENSGLLRWWDGSNWTQQTRPASPRDSGHPAAAGGPLPPGPRLPPVGQLSPPVYETAETQRSPRRWWLIGGGIGVVVLAAAAAVTLGLTGVFGKPGATVRRTQPRSVSASSPRQATSPAPVPVALGAQVVDRRAGLSFRIPAGPGWQRIPPSALGRWTLGYRTLVRRPGKAAAGGPGAVWAEVKSAPLPSSYRYTGPQDLRPDGIQFADELATTHYTAAHTVERLGITRQGANGHGGARYIIEFRVSYPGAAASRGAITSETAAVVIAGRGTRGRPAVLFITVPDTMDVSLVPRIAGSAAPVR